MEKVLKGVLRYNAAGKSQFVKEIKRLGDPFKPQTVMISCMDSRVLPSRFADSETGQIFFVRNAGNMVPHYRYYQEGNMIGTEGAALELGVVVNDIQNIVVCGHSDCKAVNTLYGYREDSNYLKYKNESPLLTWLSLHGRKSLKTMYESASKHVQNSGTYQPFVCSFKIGNEDVTARIDPDNSFGIQDKLSQLHCLQQATNFSTYPFLEERMKDGKLKVYAMWFDVHKGEVYFFSPKLERFVVIDDSSVNQMLEHVAADS